MHRIMSKCLSLSTALSLVSVTSLLLATASYAQGVDINFKTIALVGDNAPGTNNTTFNGLFTPVVGFDGQIAFSAQTTNEPGTANNTGIFQDIGGGVELVVFEGDIAPGTSSATFQRFGNPTIGGDTVAFQGESSTIPGFPENQGIFRKTSIGLEKIAVEGEQAPGTNDAKFVNLLVPTVDKNGGVAFEAQTTFEPGTSNNGGIFRDVGNGLDLVVFDGDTTPVSSGTIFTGFNDAPRTNSDGDLAFSAFTISQSGANANVGIFKHTDSGTEVIAFEGDTVPGTASATFTNLAAPSIGGSNVVFFGETTDVANTGNNQGIFKGGAFGLEKVAFEGELAPGTDNARFVDLINPVIGENDGIVFTAITTNETGTTNNRGIFRDVGNGLELVAFEGDFVPGTSDRITSFSGPAINSDGQVAFRGFFGDDNRTGLFTTGPDGSLIALLLAGQLFDDGINEERVVSTISFFGDAVRDGLGDDGTVGFFASFETGPAGVFTAKLGNPIAPVPLPATVPLLIFSLIVLGVVARLRKQPKLS